MADFKDKFSGKQYKISTFTDLSASLAAASDNTIDGRVHEELTGRDAIAKLPFRIKQGDQAKFFPGLKEGTSDGGIETGSLIHPIRDTERGIVYIPIKKKNYQNNLIGVGSHVSSTFSSGAYLQVSAAFAQKFSGVSDDTLITYCVEEFYQPTGSFSASRASLAVGAMVPSFDIKVSGSNSSSFSALHSASLNRTFDYSFPSENFITHFAFRFDDTIDDGLTDLNSDIHFPSIFLEYGGRTSNDDTSSFLLTDSTFLDLSSGSRLADGRQQNVNGVNGSDGTYTEYTFRTKLAGDADSGSLYSFIGFSQIIMYPESHGRFGVGNNNAGNSVISASFQYNSSSRDAATGSSEIRTLCFYSGSGGSSLARADYGFFVSESSPTINTNMHGTPVHKDFTLRTNADVGFYSPSGSEFSSSILIQTASGLGKLGHGPVFTQLYETGN